MGRIQISKGVIGFYSFFLTPVAMPSVAIGIPVTTYGVGLDICMAEGKCFVKGIDPKGSVSEWNANTCPEMQVLPGDRIDSYKVKGHTAQTLVTGKEFKCMRSRAVVLASTRPTIHSVRGMFPFGIGTKMKAGFDKAFFVVSSISPPGSIWKWNMDHPDQIVSVCDIVLAVDGVKGTAAEIFDMLSNDRSEEKELLILHY